MAQDQPKVSKDGNVPDLKDRVLARFLEKTEADQRIPREVVGRLKMLVERGEISSIEEITKAIRPVETTQ